MTIREKELIGRALVCYSESLDTLALRIRNSGAMDSIVPDSVTSDAAASVQAIRQEVDALLSKKGYEG